MANNPSTTPRQQITHRNKALRLARAYLRALAKGNHQNAAQCQLAGGKHDLATFQAYIHTTFPPCAGTREDKAHDAFIIHSRRMRVVRVRRHHRHVNAAIQRAHAMLKPLRDALNGLNGIQPENRTPEHAAQVEAATKQLQAAQSRIDYLTMKVAA